MKSFIDLEQIPEQDADKFALYRTFGIERLMQLLTERRLTLLEPSKWEDPYEQALQDIATNVGPSEKPSLFGLCWTTKARSDALWRIYSPNKLGVRISTTLGRLRKSISENSLRTINQNNLFLGKVTYLPEKSFRGTTFDFGKNLLGLDSGDFNRDIHTIADAIEDMVTHRATPEARTPRNIAKALFLKRTAFDHEQEVRLLYVDTTRSSSEAKNSDGLFHLAIDPMTLIRGIQFDPRLTDDVYAALSKSVKAVVGSSKISIHKSDLYKGPMTILSEKK